MIFCRKNMGKQRSPWGSLPALGCGGRLTHRRLDGGSAMDFTPMGKLWILMLHHGRRSGVQRLVL
jgi:hypothetical protein